MSNREIPHHRICAIVERTEEYPFPAKIEVTPVVVNYVSGAKQEYAVTVMYLSDRVICIPPRAIISELQPVSIDDSILEKSENEKPLPDVFKNVAFGSQMSEKEHKKLMALLLHHRAIFSTCEYDIGRCTVGKHRIDWSDSVPFKERYRRIPPIMVEEVRKHSVDLIAVGVIRKPCSPWASPVILCRMKNGKIRMCVDYRKLNSKTVRDGYALPRIEDILDCLHGSCLFTALDMK